MLDMSVRAKILELMIELKSELDLTYVYITHDLATAKFFCDRIAIMYLGRIVELGPAEKIYADPKHPYTAVAAARDPRARPAPLRPARPASRRDPRRRRAAARLPLPPPLPAAFEVCGWESRDLRAALETAGRSSPRTQYEARARADRRPRRARPGLLRDRAPLRRRALGRERRAGARGDARRNARRPVVEGRRRGGGRRGRRPASSSTRDSSRAAWTSTGSRWSATFTTPRRWPPRASSARTSSSSSAADQPGWQAPLFGWAPGQTRLVRAPAIRGQISSTRPIRMHAMPRA